MYLEARRQEQQKHQQSLKMLSDEVSQIQEVSLCTLSHSIYHAFWITINYISDIMVTHCYVCDIPRWGIVWRHWGSRWRPKPRWVYFELLSCCFTIVNLTSCVLKGFSSTSLISMFHSFLAHFLLFSPQPHTNGWKVGIPFRKNASSAPKGGAKVNEQVSSLSCDGPYSRMCIQKSFH